MGPGGGACAFCPLVPRRSVQRSGRSARCARRRRAADVDPVKARVMFAVQQPLSLSAYDDVMGVPVWKALPTWFMVADGDQTILPDAERLFAKRMGATTVEIASNHVAMVSHPDDVLQLIETAAQAVQAPA
ncbi:MAG TPA: alpha/beta fold hydrolase [Ktedonobacterales bacterium]